MKKLLVIGVFLNAGFLAVLSTGVWQIAQGDRVGGAGGPVCATINGDVNGDGGLNIADPVFLLNTLFGGGPDPVELCGSPSAPSSLPDTGQTTCYDASGNVIDCASDTCVGQDGFYQTGCSNEGRFVDNNDGTITDNCTGLMWQKGRGKILDWCEALAYCDTLELAGHADWRLPNVRELQTIVDYGRSFPAIDPIFDGSDGYFWSSTSAVGFPSVNKWAVNFSEGHVSGNPSSGIVRAVRSVK